MNFLFFKLYTIQNLSQRAQRAERAGPRPFTQRAGPGRAEKSRPVRTSNVYYIWIFFDSVNSLSFSIESLRRKSSNGECIYRGL